MRRLDIFDISKIDKSSSMSEALQQLKIKQTPPMEQFFDFCRYIIQWLFLANNN
jgi:hypothetical protein